MSAQTQATATPLYTPAVPMHEQPAWYIRGVVLLLIDVALVERALHGEMFAPKILGGAVRGLRKKLISV